MVFRLDTEKAMQAAAVLLRHHNGERMSYMRLLKLLYLADRESLKKDGRPGTGDWVVAMKNGPVRSRLDDIIKGQDLDSPHWSMFIERTNYDVRLADDPGIDRLSRFEISTLQEISEKYASLGDWDLVEEVMHKLPEYLENIPPEDSSLPIPLRDILVGVGRGEDADQIIEDAEDEMEFDRFWARQGAGG